MGIVVSDTSPLRAFQFLSLLHLLPHLYGRVWVPPAVAAEAGRSTSRVPGLDVRTLDWLSVRAPLKTVGHEHVVERLDAGEAEALYLAIELGADAVLMDDLAGRAAAVRLGLRPVGALGVLVAAKHERLVGSIRPLIDSLKSGLGFAVADGLVAEVLAAAGE